jgi:hypothetical protein
LRRAPSPSIFGLNFDSRLKSLWKDWGCIGYFDLEHPSWEQIIRGATSKPT